MNLGVLYSLGLVLAIAALTPTKCWSSKMMVNKQLQQWWKILGCITKTHLRYLIIQEHHNTNLKSKVLELEKHLDSIWQMPHSRRNGMQSVNKNFKRRATVSPQACWTKVSVTVAAHSPNDHLKHTILKYQGFLCSLISRRPPCVTK